MIETGLGSEVNKFLNDISPTEALAKGKFGSSAKSYKPGLSLFQKFLTEQALKKDSEFRTIKDIPAFFKAVEKDRKIKVATDKKFPNRDLSKSYGDYLVEKNFADKTVRAYVGSIQSLFKFYEIPITMAYAGLPSASVENPKFNWSLQLVGDFIQSFDTPLYRCLGVWFLQSGLSNIDLLKMTYGKVRQQYENDVSPICLNMVRWKTRKSGNPFRTFIGAQGIKFFREFYESLPHALDVDDALFKISDNAIEYYFARRAREFLPKGFEKRNPCCPSSLRTGFRTFLSGAKVDSSIIEYWMGHNLTADLSKTYTNKSDDSWRATWKESEKALTFSS